MGSNHVARIASLCSNLTLKLSGTSSVERQADVRSRPIGKDEGISKDSGLSYVSRRRSAFPSDQSQMKADVANFGTCDGDTLDIAIFKAQLDALRRWMLEVGGQRCFASLEASAAIAAPHILDADAAARSISANDLASRSLQDEVASAVYLLGDRRVPRVR